MKSTQTTIQVSKTTRNRIRNKTEVNENVNIVLQRLLDKYEGLL